MAVTPGRVMQVAQNVRQRAGRYGHLGLWMMSPFMFVQDYGASRREGHGALYSFGRAGAVAGMMTIAPFGSTLFMMSPMLTMAARAGVSAYWGARGRVSGSMRAFNNQFQDSPGALQERQSMQQEAQISANRARSLMGREASIMSRRYG
jgi:hypothetical protein